MIASDLRSLAVGPEKSRTAVGDETLVDFNAEPRIAGWSDCLLTVTESKSLPGVHYYCGFKSLHIKAKSRQAVADQLLAATGIEACLRGWKRELVEVGPGAHVLQYAKGGTQGAYWMGTRVDLGITENDDGTWEGFGDLGVHRIGKVSPPPPPAPGKVPPGKTGASEPPAPIRGKAPTTSEHAPTPKAKAPTRTGAKRETASDACSSLKGPLAVAELRQLMGC